jgi:hypothetical protein
MMVGSVIIDGTNCARHPFMRISRGAMPKKIRVNGFLAQAFTYFSVLRGVHRPNICYLRRIACEQ